MTTIEYSNILKEISGGIRKKEFAVFCSAGISKNSGLPLADELKRCIFEKLTDDQDDIKKILDSELPFEAFMESILLGGDTFSNLIKIDISRLLNIYALGEQNTNHILIAKLAKSGYLNTIFTTNFDLLIEKALKDEELNFEVYSNETQFSSINFNNVEDKKIKTFKIHGSIDNIDSIRTTMEAVSNKMLSSKRRKIINYLFSTGQHKAVLILGYSCSDLFDITPQIENIEKSKKEIIFVEHFDNGCVDIEDIKIKENNNPFKKFSGKRINCNTDEFVKSIEESQKKIFKQNHNLQQSKNTIINRNKNTQDTNIKNKKEVSITHMR